MPLEIYTRTGNVKAANDYYTAHSAAWSIYTDEERERKRDRQTEREKERERESGKDITADSVATRRGYKMDGERYYARVCVCVCAEGGCFR